MTARFFGEETYLALKAATRRLVGKAGGQESAASITRVCHQQLNRYGKEQRGIEFVPVDVVADLEADTGAPEVTRVLARLTRHVLVPLPPVEADAVWAEHIGSACKEYGEAMSGLGSALANGGTITEDEIREKNLIAETEEAIVAMTEVLELLKKTIEAEGR